jgi:hypothetical protein
LWTKTTPLATSTTSIALITTNSSTASKFAASVYSTSTTAEIAAAPVSTTAEIATAPVAVTTSATIDTTISKPTTITYGCDLSKHMRKL